MRVNGISTVVPTAIKSGSCKIQHQCIFLAMLSALLFVVWSVNNFGVDLNIKTIFEWIARTF